MKGKLTLGPILFHWPAEKKRDFYFRIADEAALERVYIGEVICAKRAPFLEPLYDQVAGRLQRAGKEVVFSTLAEVMTRDDRKLTAALCAGGDAMIEANDTSALWALTGREHAIGPFMNVYNEDAVAVLAANGAVHVTLPPELPGKAMAALAPAARALRVTMETQVYGRVPLALSARCYHARAHGRAKDNCRYVCEDDPDGMDLATLSGGAFLAINGIQTLSHACLNLMQELREMQGMGVDAFRLSPHSHDMVETTRLFRAVLEQELAPAEAAARLAETGLAAPFANGFYHGTEGQRWLTADGRSAGG